jgi:hypothetical protein
LEIDSMTFAGRPVLSAIGLVAVLAGVAGAGDSFPKRMFDDQNTSNVGDRESPVAAQCGVVVVQPSSTADLRSGGV